MKHKRAYILSVTITSKETELYLQVRGKHRMKAVYLMMSLENQ